MLLISIWSQASSPLGAYPLLTADALYSIQDSPIMCVQTDASGVDGRGGYYGKLSAKSYQYWSYTWESQHASIMEVSMAAELYALLDYLTFHNDSSPLIIWLTDSASAALVILKGYTSCNHSLPILKQIMDLLDRSRQQIVALWIPRDQNQFADHLSHLSVLLNSSSVSGSGSFNV